MKVVKDAVVVPAKNEQVNNVVDPAMEAPQNAVVVYEAIDKTMAENDKLVFVENGAVLETLEEKIASLKMCYRLAVLRRFNVRLRDAENKVIKHELTINGIDFRIKAPSLLVDDNGIPTENIETYHQRIWTKAKIAFSTVLKGLERIDFAPKLG